MIIRHVSSSSWVRAFCFASSWLTERSKWAFQAWSAREHSLFSKFILALVSSLITKSSILFNMSRKFESRESHLSQWMSWECGHSSQKSGFFGSLIKVMYGTMVAVDFVSAHVRFIVRLQISFLLLSSLVAFFQPNAALSRFPLKFR